MIPDSIKRKTIRAIEQLYGLCFPLSQWPDLERKIRLACEETGMPAFDEFIRQISNGHVSGDQSQILVNQLTVGETYFFRERTALDVFNDQLIRPLIEDRRKQLNYTIIIWSAGCCSGEEPYTLAILMREVLPDIDKWQIIIMGTDINANFIKKAKKGHYTSWSFRETPPWVKEKYFIPVGQQFAVIPEVRNMVTFKKINLLDASAFPSTTILPGSVDFVFCRNVLMYFSTQQIINVVDRFGLCLKEGGWLITSPVEVSNDGFTTFTPVRMSNWVFFKNMQEKKQEWVSDSIAKQVAYNLTDSAVLSPQERKLPKVEFNSTIAVGTNIKTTDFEVLLDEVTELFKKQQYKDVVDRLSPVPENNGARVLLVQALVNIGKRDEAQIRCEEFIQLNGSDARFYSLLASIQLETGNDRQAETLLRQALYIDQTLLQAHFMMGNLMRKQGQVRAAESHFRNVNTLLALYNEEDQLPGFDGMTALKLKNYISRFL